MKPIINLEIKEANIKAHADIEEEMQLHKNSWYTFEIRLSGGNIVDFVIRDYIDYEKLIKK